MDRRAVWPLLGLRVRTPRVELRPAGPDLAFELADLAAAGIHDPATMPFSIPWTDASPPELQRSSVQYLLGTWSTFTAASWRLNLAVFAEGRLAGLQDLQADDFPVLRQVTTGSWLGRAFQGRGFGREMRAAVLHLAFAGLGAERALTSAFTDNAASLAVTRALGYRPNGSEWAVRRGRPAELARFVLHRADWEERRRDDIVVEGVDDRLLDFLGLT